MLKSYLYYLRFNQHGIWKLISLSEDGDGLSLEIIHGFLFQSFDPGTNSLRAQTVLLQQLHNNFAQAFLIIEMKQGFDEGVGQFITIGSLILEQSFEYAFQQMKVFAHRQELSR